MSKYTTEIRFICETLNGDVESSGYNSVNTILANVHNQVFDFDYPIFDTNYKPVLEKKILKHFYTREIGYETYGRWKLALDAKMNEIMPYYNKLYNSELITFNPLYDFEEHTVGHRTHDDEINEHIDDKRKDTGTITNDKTGTVSDDGENKNTGTVTKTTTGTVADVGTGSSNDGGTDTTTRSGGDSFTRWDKYSDTPQGTVNNMALNSDGYLTDARYIEENHTGTRWSDTTNYGKTNSSTDNNTRTYNTTEQQTLNTKTELDNTRTFNTEDKQTLNTTRDTDTDRRHEYDSIVDYAESVQGKSRGKSYSKMLNEFRTTFLNIDMMIINDLEELFMQIW